MVIKCRLITIHGNSSSHGLQFDSWADYMFVKTDTRFNTQPFLTGVDTTPTLKISEEDLALLLLSINVEFIK